MIILDAEPRSLPTQRRGDRDPPICPSSWNCLQQTPQLRTLHVVDAGILPALHSVVLGLFPPPRGPTKKYRNLTFWRLSESVYEAWKRSCISIIPMCLTLRSSGINLMCFQVGVQGWRKRRTEFKKYRVACRVLVP